MCMHIPLYILLHELRCTAHACSYIKDAWREIRGGEGAQQGAHTPCPHPPTHPPTNVREHAHTASTRALALHLQLVHA